ncbi:hypothetical protein AB2L57_10665 [Microbacterium sp. HA-8]|uniref:phage tail tube protein n=1 Tax=Microbacterium sp. HA-8 TaxID=3234200 RepID=UPI0038F7F699
MSNAHDILVAGTDASVAGGYFQVGEITATAPTDATTALGTGYVNAGLITPDGVTLAETKSTEPVKDASGAIVRVITTEYGVRVTLSLLAPTLKSFQLMRGAENVTVSPEGDIVTKFAKAELPVQSWAVHFVDAGRKIRLYLPEAQIVETSDIAYNVTTPTNYEITIECRPDADGGYAYEYRQGVPGVTVIAPEPEEA